MGEGKAQIAWNWPSMAAAGIKGEDPFNQAYPNLTTLGNGLGINHFHFFAAADSKYETLDEIFADVKNLRIALSPVHVGDNWMFEKILEYYETNGDKLKGDGASIFRGSYTEQTEQFKNNNVDVVFTMGGIPSSTVTDAAVTRDIKFLPMSQELIEHLKQYAVGSDVIPAGTYPQAANGNQDIPSATVTNALLVNKNVPEEVVYAITKTINENLDRLPAFHGSLASYKPENAVLNLGADLHPGAKKYYEEAGILK